ncbi:MAG: hypothetical protein COA84_11290 [Robiginitomaculum sp.]|nr:MAG: hypothetical protein COA84_11290 [Robiginitomaculum sp.]
MQIATTDHLPGQTVETALGIARGSVVRARFFGRDFIAGLRSLVGGEVNEYTNLLAESREQALERMIHHAKSMGADAVVNVRFTSNTIMEGTAEMLAYGTAVKLK